MSGNNETPASTPPALSGETKRLRGIRNASRLADDSKNACIKESQQSLKCIMDNDFERDKCSMYFQNYRNCLDFWKRVCKDRRRAGIKPHMPPFEERESIKEQYAERSRGKQT